MITIRRVHMSDIPELVKVLNQLSPTTNSEQVELHIMRMINNAYINMWVATIDNKVVGHIAVYELLKACRGGSSVAQIEDVVVDSEYRKQGIAEALMNHALDYIQKHLGLAYKIQLQRKEELQGFYEKFGFKADGIDMRKDVFGYSWFGRED